MMTCGELFSAGIVVGAALLTIVLVVMSHLNRSR